MAPVNGNYLVLLTAATLALLLGLILITKLHAFLALLISSMAMGLAAGMAPEKVLKSIQNGFGEALGFIAVVIGLGAMIGRFLEYSGGGRALADWLLLKFGKDRAAWAVLIASFLVGLPIFFEVGFIILVPVVWNLTRETKRSLLFYGLPMAAALTVNHALVPPHPAPAAASQLLGGDLGKTIIYGVMLSIPMTITAGMIYGQWIARRMHIQLPEIADSLTRAPETDGAPPVPMVILLLVMPVLLTFGATMAGLRDIPLRSVAVFLGHPYTALLITTLVAIYCFGIRRGLTREKALKMATDSLLPVGSLILIIGGGGALKQVIVDSGVGSYLGQMLMTSAISPLVVVWLISLCMRLAQGSATVAIITAAGIAAPLVKNLPGYSPNELVLALCCGGSAFSHMSDSGFWIVSQYYGLSVPQCLKTWTAMKTVAATLGLGIILIAHALLR
ncbi:MAG TPA: gluconate:H+ symporter [Candidatus Acidoferrales bacterium]|nr:gluconate:H+ symporter [Candidatus Acidoferrales bacterium]